VASQTIGGQGLAVNLPALAARFIWEVIGAESGVPCRRIARAEGTDGFLSKSLDRIPCDPAHFPSRFAPFGRRQASLTALPTASIMRCFFQRRQRRAESRQMLKKSELTEFKSALLILQARIRGDVQQLTREALDRNDGGGDSKSPTHIAELGTQTFEQDFSLRVAESDQDVLAEIDAALRRIEAGTFGSCVACLEEGKPPSKSLIPKARLKAIPYAKNCVECERKRENLSL